MELDIAPNTFQWTCSVQCRAKPTSMESLLVKIFATALALSQVTTTPDAVKTQFDRGRDQEEADCLTAEGRNPPRTYCSS
jgi:hypothetical protein